MTPNDTMKISDCCGATMTELCNDDTGFCPDCRDHTDWVDVCVECNEEECVCVDEAEVKRMKQLYDAEVHYGIHVPQGVE